MRLSQIANRKLFLLAVILLLCCGLAAVWLGCREQLQSNRVAILNRLRDEINANCGYKDGTPRVNCGPCIRFAIAFHDRWNAAFPDKTKFACLVANSLCAHVAVRLPDGSYFDGGNGVLSRKKLAAMFSDCSLREMDDLDTTLFERGDIKLLHETIGPQENDHYRECPNYSDDITATLIDKYLRLLATQDIKAKD